MPHSQSEIRTAGYAFKSRPSRPLTIGAPIVTLMDVALPYTYLGTLMGFTPLPLPFFGGRAYQGLVQVAKFSLR